MKFSTRKLIALNHKFQFVLTKEI